MEAPSAVWPVTTRRGGGRVVVLAIFVGGFTIGEEEVWRKLINWKMFVCLIRFSLRKLDIQKTVVDVAPSGNTTSFIYADPPTYFQDPLNHSCSSKPLPHQDYERL